MADHERNDPRNNLAERGWRPALPPDGLFPAAAVDMLTASILADRRTRYLGSVPLPNRRRVIGLLDDLAGLVFPGLIPPGNPRQESDQANPALLGRRDVPAYVETVGDRAAVTLFEEITAALCYERARDLADDRTGVRGLPQPLPAASPDCAEKLGDGVRRDCHDRAVHATREFMSRLGEVRRLLSLDVQAALDGDPAACSTDEAILTYPGVRAIMVYRLAHELYRLDVPLIARMMTEFAHSRTGIDIHPGARIGESFFIDHGTGVVIGETTDIGRHCKIYQGVTIGAKSFPKDERGRLIRGVKRHPTLRNRVTVYASATILGGDTVIGDDCVINGGVFLVRSVPAGHIVRSEPPQLLLRTNPAATGLEMDASGI